MGQNALTPLLLLSVTETRKDKPDKARRPTADSAVLARYSRDYETPLTILSVVAASTGV